jgi:hypothetical protein
MWRSMPIGGTLILAIIVYFFCPENAGEHSSVAKHTFPNPSYRAGLEIQKVRKTKKAQHRAISKSLRL